MSAKRPALVQSLDRACDILEALCVLGGEARLKDISLKVGLSKSTAYGLLATMHARGLVGQTETGNYTLGLRLLQLGNAAAARLDLRKQAGDILRELMQRFQETVHLVMLDGSDVVYIDKVESPQSMRIVTQIGSRMPAFCTGVGKAILANLAPAVLEQLLQGVELKPFTRNTITDLQRLRNHLVEVGRRGYCLDDEEFMEGLRCVAAPIFDHSGACVGAMSVSGPSVRMGPDRIEAMIPAACEASRAISRRMGSGSRLGSAPDAGEQMEEGRPWVGSSIFWPN